MSLVMTGLLANASLQRDRRHLERVIADSNLKLPDLVDAVFRYLGAPHADLLKKLEDRISVVAVEDGILQADQAPFNADGSLNDTLLALIPGRSARYIPLVAHDRAIEMPLLDKTLNVHCSTELPARINRRLDHQFCPPVAAYRVDRQCLFVGPQGFAVFDRDRREAIRAATSRQFGDALFDLEPVLTNNIPVLVQDIFNGFNFSHFLFDWIARATLFASSEYFDPQRHVFVFGGMPNRFHHIVIEGLKAAFGLSDLNIFFPPGPVVFACPHGIVFFSDNMSVSAHPAQMARSETIGLLNRVVDAAPVERQIGTGRIYISRGDAGRRMLRNERELFAALEPLGFEAVRMADHPIEKQIRIVSSAECVVGAHGMGLTHMAFHPGRLRLVELFNPDVGTDTYALPAKALGFDYHPVIGARVEGSEDFMIDVPAVLATLKGLEPRAGAADAEPSRYLDNDMPHWFGGVQRTKAVEVQPKADHPRAPVFYHSYGATIADSNVGWWGVRDLRPGRIYRLTCHVLIPADFAGDGVALSASTRALVHADMSIRDNWQRLSITLTCPDDERNIDLVLRVYGQFETYIFSAGWEVSSGPF
jgi:hypothetical protein